MKSMKVLYTNFNKDIESFDVKVVAKGRISYYYEILDLYPS